MDFKKFFEEAQQPETKSQKARIPLDNEVFRLRNLFADAGYELKVVGGAVRDYLFHILNGEKGRYKPKDIDLVTNATPDQIIELLNTTEAEMQRIKTLPIGKQFGVVKVVFFKPNGSVAQEYEIATYRQDVGGDGRRPDEVIFTSVEQDAARRDLTMNALYYDIPDNPGEDGEIKDYHGGQGFEDIKNKLARPIGNASDRFDEDNLRVMRLIRFFARYNPGSPQEIEKNDPETAKALRDFKHMSSVSSERIAAEFLSGLKSAISPVNYLKSLHHFGLMDRMFPNLKINKHFDRLNLLRKDPEMMRNPRIVLAFLLKDNDPQSVASNLSDLTYPVNNGDMSAYLGKGSGGDYKLVPNVAFLLKLLKFSPERIYDISKERDRIRPQVGKGQFTSDDINQYNNAHNREIIAWSNLFGLDLNTMSNFVKFSRSVSARDPRIAGKSGPDIGNAIKDLEHKNFLNMKRSQ